MNNSPSHDTYELERVHDLLNYLTAAYLTVHSLESITQGSKEVLRAKESMRECIAVARSCFTTGNVGLFSIDEEVVKVLSMFEHLQRTHSVTLTYSNSSPKSIAQGDHIHFKRALANVIKNAIEAASFSHEKAVKIRVRKSGEYISISISDSGLGVAKHISGKIGRERVSEKDANRGYGMLSTKRIIEDQYGGTICLKNNTKKNGACCTISLRTKDCRNTKSRTSLP